MSKALRLIGGLNVVAGIILAIMFQTLKVSYAEIAAAHYAHLPPPSGLDSFTANVGSLSMLVGAAMGALLFFAFARILDRVEAIHSTVSTSNASANG
jgi:hypothetical protein